MEFLRNNKPLVGVGAVIGAAVVAWLAFGIFGVQALFIDKEVDQANPFAVETVADASTDDGEAADSGDAATAEDTDASTDTETDAEADAAATDDGAAAPFVESSGSFISLDHPAVGEASIISDGERRFLRFEEFETDNGPDLFVYLVAGTSADGDEGLFDEDFVNLGRLQGNVGDQNYEVDIDLDLERYNTVVIWCDRFNSSFAAADLI